MKDLFSKPKKEGILLLNTTLLFLIICLVIDLLPNKTPYVDNPIKNASAKEEVPTDYNTGKTVFGSPTRLSIPQIGLESTIEPVRLDADGKMANPEIDSNVAWFSEGYKPGEVGNAVIAGHYDTVNGTPSTFYSLTSLEIGDEISVYDSFGNAYVFVVTMKSIYANEDFPLAEVFGNSDQPRLNLITCEGYFDQVQRNYTHRTVVYTKLKNTVSNNSQETKLNQI